MAFDGDDVYWDIVDRMGNRPGINILGTTYNPDTDTLYKVNDSIHVLEKGSYTR